MDGLDHAGLGAPDEGLGGAEVGVGCGRRREAVERLGDAAKQRFERRLGHAANPGGPVGRER